MWITRAPESASLVDWANERPCLKANLSAGGTRGKTPKLFLWHQCTCAHINMWTWVCACLHEHGYMPPHRYFWWLCLRIQNHENRGTNILLIICLTLRGFLFSPSVLLPGKLIWAKQLSQMNPRLNQLKEGVNKPRGLIGLDQATVMFPGSWGTHIKPVCLFQHSCDDAGSSAM